MAKEEGVYVTYKAFDKDLKCNGFQYEIGKSYHTEEDIHLIHHGFHGCVTPLGLLSYYCKHREITEDLRLLNNMARFQVSFMTEILSLLPTLRLSRKYL